jgi:hypothetical protein
MIRAALPLLLLVQPAAAMAQDHPDLSGFWAPSFDTDPAGRDADLLDKLPEDAVLVEDTGIVELPRGEYGGLIPTPKALEQAEDWQPEDEMTLDRVCLPPSIVYAIQGPFPFEIHQTDELIVFKYEYFDQVRLVFMDGREHPDDAPLSKMGFSTGYWDGDDLVVETSRIAPSTITNNGLDHSGEIAMRERYRLSEDGARLMATQWFSDPEMLENDGARYIAWDRREGEHVYPYECDPTFALEYQEIGAE